MPIYNWIDKLPDDVCAAVKSVMTRRTFVDGQTVYRRGDDSKEVYHILSGEVQLRVNYPGGKDMLCITFQPGDSFGETNALDGGARAHDAIVHGETQLAVLKPYDLQRLQTQHPQIVTELTRLLCMRLRMLFSLIVDATLLSVPAQMARRLVDVATQYGYCSPGNSQQDLNFTQDDLASMLGASRQTVSRTLKQWEADGLIELSYGHIILRDIDRLIMLADPS